MASKLTVTFVSESNEYHVRGADYQTDDSTQPWNGLIPTRTRIVKLVSIDGKVVLRCSCPYTRENGLPCRHALAVNKGRWDIEDIDWRWLNALASADLDGIIFDPDITSAVSAGPLLRVERSDAREELETGESPDPDSITISSDSEESQVEENAPTTYSAVMREFADLMHLAGEDKESLSLVLDGVVALRQELYKKLKSALKEAPDRPVEGSKVADSVCAKRTRGKGSNKRAKPVHESRKRFKFSREPHDALEGYEDIFDIQGSQPGRKKKKIAQK